jgi:putative heme-binding domain-containing protein
MTSARRLALASCTVACLVAIAAAAPPSGGPTAWASGPLDVVVALPRPADAAAVAGLVGRTIPYFEEAAEGATAEPLGTLHIAGAVAEDEGRTLRLAVDPQPRPARYVLDLGAIAPGGAIAYNLRGVEAARIDGDDPFADPSWIAWLPTPDPAGFGSLATSSAQHARRLADLARVGLLRLDSQVGLPAGKHLATVESTAEIVECLLGDGEPEGGITKTADGRWVAKFTIEGGPRPAFFSLTIRTGPDAPTPSVKLTAAAPDAAAQAQVLGPGSYLLPWVSADLASARPAPMDIPDLSGGDPKRGEEAFFSKEALCAQCHVVKGRGEHVGPDLTTIGRKGAEYLYRSIAAPSEQITPDYVTYTVSLHDGRVAAGVVRADGPDAIRVIDTEAKSVTFPRGEIDQFRPAATSIMPVGLLPALGEARVRDLIAYLVDVSGE